jgi:integrase
LEKHSPVTVNVELRTLRTAFNVAVRWELIDKNPFSKVQMASVPEAPPSYFTKEDFQKLLAMIAEEWLRDIVIFTVLTGLRRGEVVNLRWDQVNFDRKLIHIRSSPNFQTKTGKNRVVPLNEAAFQILSRRKREETSDYVFSINREPISGSWVSHRFLECLVDAGLGDTNLHFHSLRHTFASWLVQDGVSLYEVQKLLGHSSIAVTQVYSHLQPEQLHATVNRLDFGSEPI